MTFLARVRKAWGVLARDQRRAALAAIVLFLSMFLPWYEKSVSAIVGRSLASAHDNLNAFQAFSFVEAAVLLIAAGVLVLLFTRAEQRAFHLPGGDGTVILAGGVWAALLIFWRMLDKPNASNGGINITATIGLQWGIFIALGAAIALAFAGARVRAARHQEPFLAADPLAPAEDPLDPTPPPPSAAKPAQRPTQIEGQLSIDDGDPTEVQPRLPGT